MSRFIAPGVSAISCVRCSDLPPCIMQLALAGVGILLSIPSRPVRFSSRPEFTVDDSLEKGVRTQTASLSFRSTYPLPADLPLAFIVSTADGSAYLVGFREPPFPVVTSVFSAGNPSGDPAGYTHSVSLKARLALIPCLL